jgi:hypothetical protein
MRRTLRGLMAAPKGPFSEYAPTAAGIKSSGELSVSRPFFYAFAVSAPATSQNGGKFSVARKARIPLGAASGPRFQRKTPAQEGCAGAKSITSAGCNPSIDRMPSVAIGFNQKKAAVEVLRGMLFRECQSAFKSSAPNMFCSLFRTGPMTPANAVWFIWVRPRDIARSRDRSRAAV